MLIAVLIAALMMLSTLALLLTQRQKTKEILATEAENQGILVETFKGALTLKTTSAAPELWSDLQSRSGLVVTPYSPRLTSSECHGS